MKLECSQGYTGYDQFIILHLHPCPVRHNKNNKPNSSQVPHSNCITTARITPVVLPAHWVRDGFGIPAEGGWQGVSLVSLGIAIASRSAAKTRQSKELNLCYAEIGCFTQWSDCVFAFRCMFVWGKYVIPSWGATKLCTLSHPPVLSKMVSVGVWDTCGGGVAGGEPSTTRHSNCEQKRSQDEAE